MPKTVMTIVYVLLVAIGFMTMYTILNAGSPDSLVRLVFPDPSSDVYIAMVMSLVVFILGFIVFFNRDSQGFQNLVEMNSERIRLFRNDGKTDQEIADSILAAMGSYSGYRHNLARKKLAVYLSRFR